MIPILGQFFVWIAVLSSLAMIVFGSLKTENQNPLKKATALQFISLGLASLTLVYLFLVSDFSVQSVHNNSHTLKPLFYKISGSWGNHEGSMLLWALISATYIGAFSKYFEKPCGTALYARTLQVLGFASLGLNLFVATLSSPFHRMPAPFPVEGQGLNPLLQDVGLAIHPPVLYLGYVGLIIPWGLAVSGLVCRIPAQKWAKIVKPWTYIALAFLTTGIILGSWWAYRELGWGGWWFWDPVENASLIPWLIGLALAHSVMALSTRGGLGNWSFALAILAFGASVLGTFLVRSGSLVSVHAFAADPGRGIAILGYLCAIVGSGLIALFLRGADTAPPEYKLFSRDGALLAHNLFVMAITVTVLLGTAYPPIIQAINLPPLAVGAPFYHAAVVPFMVFVLIFMAFGPEIPWRQAKLKPLLKQSVIAISLAVISGVIVSILNGSIMGVVATSLSVLVIAFSVRASKRSLHMKKASRLPMAIAHFGVGIFALAVSINTLFTVEIDTAISEGEKIQSGRYELELAKLKETKGKNYIAIIGTVNVFKDTRLIKTLTPEYRYYSARNMPTTESDIRFNVFRDLRASMNVVEQSGEQTIRWALRFHMRPAMIWLWIGTLIASLGLFLAARLSWKNVLLSDGSV